MNAGRAQNVARGFTLIELLIGAVVSAVLLAALYAVFHGLLRMQSRSYARMEETAPRAHAVALLKEDMENMVLPTGVLAGGVLGQSEGQDDRHSDTLEFCTTSGKVKDATPWGEIQKVEYSLGESDGQEADRGVQLVRAVTRNILATNAEDQRESTTLLDGVESLEFEYFDGQTWSDTWDSTAVENSLPKAIRVRVGFPPEEAKGLATAPIEIVCEVVARNPVANSASTAGSAG